VIDAAGLVRLGLASFEIGEVSAALNFFLEARALDDNPLIDMDIGFALNHLARFDEGISYIEKAYRRNPDNPAIKRAFGDALIRDGRWLEAWEIYNPSIMFTQLEINVPPWKGESLFGKEVLIVADGGFGDTIMFSRYLPEFKRLGACASLLNTPALVPLFYDQKYFSTVNQSNQRHFDYWITQFDIPKIFQVTPENVLWPGPYIKAPDPKQFFRDSNHVPHVGFAWTSREPGHHYRFRSISKEQAMRFYQYRGVQWVNLQYELPAPDWVDDVHIQNWAETANLIEALDLIITIDSAQLHLAGAMGKETWAILGGFIDGKFGKAGESCPWYPSVRCFRNGTFGFENTICNVLHSLQQWVEERGKTWPSVVVTPS
jgi:tetratricopeptide (TPR) repeat protein